MGECLYALQSPFEEAVINNVMGSSPKQCREQVGIPSSIPNVASRFSVSPHVVFDVVDDGYDPSSSSMQVLVSIALQILVNTLSVSESGLDQWRVTTGSVYVLLGFGCSLCEVKKGILWQG